MRNVIFWAEVFAIALFISFVFASCLLNSTQRSYEITFFNCEAG